MYPDQQTTISLKTPNFWADWQSCVEHHYSLCTMWRAVNMYLSCVSWPAWPPSVHILQLHFCIFWLSCNFSSHMWVPGQQPTGSLPYLTWQGSSIVFSDYKWLMVIMDYDSKPVSWFSATLWLIRFTLALRTILKRIKFDIYMFIIHQFKTYGCSTSTVLTELFIKSFNILR